MMSEDYQEEVARMRMERKQAEAADQYEQLRQQYNEAVENRENASLQILGNDGDRSEWDYWDSQVEDAERVGMRRRACGEHRGEADETWSETAPVAGPEAGNNAERFHEVR